MPFHYAALKDDERSFHSILHADGVEEVHEVVAGLPGKQRLTFQEMLSTSLDDFLALANNAPSPTTRVRIRKDFFRASMHALIAEGGKVMDRYVSGIAPFEDPSDFVGEDIPAVLCSIRDYPAHGCDAVPVEMSARQLVGRTMCALREGMRRRIEDTMGYSFYLVRAEHEGGTLVNFLKRAYEESEIREGLDAYGAPLKLVFAERLSPDIQLFCAHLEEHRNVNEEEPMQGGWKELTLPYAFLPRFVAGMHLEASRIQRLHPDAYPDDAPQDVPDGMDVRAEESHAWEDLNRAMETKTPFTVTYLELGNMVTDLLSGGNDEE